MEKSQKKELLNNLRIQIRAEIKRTNVGPRKFFSMHTHKPKGVTVGKVESFVYNKNSQSLALAHAAMLLEEWRKLPSETIIPLTEDMVALLKYHHKRTQISPEKLLKEPPGDTPPSSLNANLISSWLYSQTASLNAEHYAYVLAAWESLPDGDKIPISEEILKQLEYYQIKTGIRPQALFRGKRSDMPKGLSSNIVKGWFSGKPKTAREDHLDYVLTEWAKQPDKGHAASLEGKHFVELSTSMIQKLENFEKKGILPDRIFIGAKNIPIGLNGSVIKDWLTQKPQTVREDWLNYVVKRCAVLERRPAIKLSLTADILKL